MTVSQRPLDRELVDVPPRRSALSISVFLIDDHPILLTGLEALIQAHPSLVLVGSARTVEEALRRIPKLQPRVVVLDLFIGEKETVAHIPDLRTEGVTEVLTLSMSNRLSLIDQALHLGARGFVGKHEPPSRIVEGILAVAEQRMFLEEGVAVELLRRRAQRNQDAGKLALTPREREIFDKMGEGLTPSEIAKRLGVSAKTVETHKENMKRKLGNLSASELRRLAIQERDRLSP
jgi:DNA-binding NarL/FixJ family response regulator